MNHFFVRLAGARPDFLPTMTDAERATMGEHGAYWRTKLAEDKVVVFGPVADPKGAWGMGVVKAESEAEVRAMEAADPAVTTLGMHYEILPMLAAVYKPA